MTLDEAILHAREVAERNRKQYKNCHSDRTDIRYQTCKECAEEHEQLMQWLEDYKHIKQWKSDVMDGFCRYDASSFEELVANARNKAIDDFVKEFKRKTPMENRLIDDLAEQLKAGITND